LTPRTPESPHDQKRTALEAGLASLGQVEVPMGLKVAVMNDVAVRPPQISVKLSFAAASFAVWALAVHQLVSWTTAQLSGAV